jgi:hypothetical protein
VINLTGDDNDDKEGNNDSFTGPPKLLSKLQPRYILPSGGTLFNLLGDKVTANF